MAPKYAKDQHHGFVNHVESVAVVGASGQLGRHITEHLLKTGKHSVTALTRKGGNATFPAEVKVAPVDYGDETSLISALRGHDFLIISLAFTPDMGETHGKIVRAAVKAGVPHLIPNAYTTDVVLDHQSVGDEIGVGTFIRKLLEDIDAVGSISWTLLVTGLWYEFSVASPPDWLGFDLRGRKVQMFDDGQRRINMSTWPQLGRAVAALLSLKKVPEDEQDVASTTLEHFRNKPLYVSSFLVNQREILDSVERATNTTDVDWDITHESTSERVAVGREQFSKGNLRGMAKVYYARLHYPGSEAVYEHKLHNDVLDLPKESLDDATKAALKLSQSGWTPDGQ
ncbi:uncharacterized protein B0I36DRAFT_364365 [Microdochium trichocladiopsis]|uniref:NAD(P)-binding domain-containing protein n=1 Tax=Microdochium trichocladiopsis TaxID=1682393 RepID=A0A9P8Y3K3_9PEZI|nr:uncharacterized protein B0I36DRAFT_364365 [Microdochium trichocladiopsis]KAH7029894.1 hypothetical protein B0I36DRAFT_364365 [Microdochium trichocladiopsis]